MARATLDTILAATRVRVAALQPEAQALARLAQAVPPPRAFADALRGPSVGVIAEVKRRSPSAGVIAAELDPVAHATAYAAGGAVAISVLTDEQHFGGTLADLRAVAQAVERPVLRKDFILDELQLFEARAAGASAVLLIVRALEPGRLAALAQTARELGLGTLIEVHTLSELDPALAAMPTAVGVNSRDLSTFRLERAQALAILAQVPRGVPAVAESGIETRADVERYADAGADLVLVGTAVARADPRHAVRALAGVARQAGARP